MTWCSMDAKYLSKIIHSDILERISLRTKVIIKGAGDRCGEQASEVKREPKASAETPD